MRHFILYLFPLSFDVILGVSLFAGRHSLAERGLDTAAVGSILTMYGMGYIVASLLMAKIIRPKIARYQMMGAVVMTVAALVTLANCENVRVIQAFFLVLPFGASLFFNAYQSFMLGYDSGAGKPLTRTVAHFTGSWSIGYALGPLAASFVKKNLDWGSAYYAAAGIAACIGFAALLFRSPAATVAPSEPLSGPEQPRKSLAPAAWIGTVTGWAALSMIFTFWPVQAQSLGMDVRFKGGVEFAFAIAQSLTAFALAAVPAAYYFSRRLPLAGLFGAFCALCFAFSSRPVFFILGAAAFGVYSAHFFNTMVFHSMVEKDKAVRRVALNEVFVGVSYMIASPIAGVIHRFFPGFPGSYSAISLFIIAGITLEWVVMGRIRGKTCAG